MLYIASSVTVMFSRKKFNVNKTGYNVSLKNRREKFLFWNNLQYHINKKYSIEEIYPFVDSIYFRLQNSVQLIQ